jgi:hypothetical protein
MFGVTFDPHDAERLRGDLRSFLGVGTPAQAPSVEVWRLARTSHLIGSPRGVLGAQSASTPDQAPGAVDTACTVHFHRQVRLGNIQSTAEVCDVHQDVQALSTRSQTKGVFRNLTRRVRCA